MSNQRLLSVTIKPQVLDEFTENPLQSEKGNTQNIRNLADVNGKLNIYLSEYYWKFILYIIYFIEVKEKCEICKKQQKEFYQFSKNNNEPTPTTYQSQQSTTTTNTLSTTISFSSNKEQEKIQIFLYDSKNKKMFYVLFV